MASLNDLVDLHIRANKRHFAAIGVTLTLELFEGTMLDVVEYEESPTYPLCRALGQVSMEAEDAKSSNIRYQTKLDGEIYKIILSHNGKRIPETKLLEINADLKSIAEGTKQHDMERHGNLIAAQFVKEIGGRIYIENIDEEDYAVRTTIEIPYTNATHSTNGSMVNQ